MATTKDDEKSSLAVNDAWTGMLAISLLALILGSVLVFLDWRNYMEKPDKLRASQPPITQQQDDEAGKDAKEQPQGQPGQPPEQPPVKKGPPGKKG